MQQWLNLKTQKTQFGDNKHKPARSFEHAQALIDNEQYNQAHKEPDETPQLP